MIPIFLLTLFLLPLAATSASLVRTYEHGPIPFDANGDLYFTIDLETSTAYLAVRVKNVSSIITETSNYVGIGISEPTSGSMLGSDIATVEFDTGATDVCQLVDRHVPFVAYPLGETAPNSPSVFPIEDKCQDDASWTLVSCERDAEAGEMILEVSRSLSAHDEQDRDIPPGINNVIYAFGGSFAYHGSRRASTRVILYQEEGGDESLIGAGQPELPADIDGTFDITATEYTVPDEKVTIYACTSKRFVVPKGEKKMIVAMEPLINSTNDALVHHLTLYLCAGEEYLDQTSSTVECTTADNDIDGPLANPFAKCSTFIFGYAKGVNRQVLPLEAGVVVDDTRNILVMETHYDNPGGESGSVDSSGVRLHFTDTMRKFEASSLITADAFVTLGGEKVKNNFEYEFTCPSACTNKFSESINVFSSFLHMHTTGREIYSNKFDEDNKFVENINKVNFWSDNFQNQIPFSTPKKVSPGEQVSVTCVYDTTKRPDTEFGLQTVNEMCMNFLGYYPVQRDPVTGHEINLCAFALFQGQTFTICGDGAQELALNTSVLNLRNPSFEDMQGANTTFPTEPDVCEVGTGATPSDEPGPAVSGSPETTREPVGVVPGGSPDPEESSIPGGGGLEGESESAEPSAEDDNVCFPASATVSLRGGMTKRMEDIVIGDEVLVSADTYSTVFMFTHRSAGVAYTFVRLSCDGGVKLSLTAGHFLYVNGALSMAGDVQVGDTVTLGEGGTRVVRQKAYVREKGLYNPQTLHGDIVVDGVVASTYTKSIMPDMAHGLLTPLRWVWWIGGVDVSSPFV